MTTYYVAKTGNDSNAGTSQGAPKLTLGSVLAYGFMDDGDTAEIIDEGTYSEYSLDIWADNITIAHTASELGRPVIDAGGNANHIFEIYGSPYTLVGLELKSPSNSGNPNFGQIIKKGSASDFHYFHISGCFIHDTPRLFNFSINNRTGTPSTIKDSVLYFGGSRNACFSAQHGVEISNCLFTSSADTEDEPLLLGAGAGSATDITASFSTFIHRGAAHSSDPIITSWAKVINCIVSGSGMGISSDDHTYNLLNVSGEDFRNYANDANGSAGTGDIIDTVPLFVDGAAAGSATSIAGNYNLQASSPAVNAGTAFDGIVVDISGTSRSRDVPDIGCFEYYSSGGGGTTWDDYTAQPNINFESGFVIQSPTNLASNHRFNEEKDPKQAPFSLGAKGPISLRGRTTAYKVEK